MSEESSFSFSVKTGECEYCDKEGDLFPFMHGIHYHPDGLTTDEPVLICHDCMMKLKPLGWSDKGKVYFKPGGFFGRHVEQALFPWPKGIDRRAKP